VSLLRSGTCLRRDARGRLTIILDPRLALLAPPVKRVSRLALFGLAYFQIRAGARERIFRASCISYLRRRRELDSARAENCDSSRCSASRLVRQSRKKVSRSALRFDSIRASAISPTDPRLLVTGSLFLPDAWPRYRDVALNSAKETSKLADSGAFDRERLRDRNRPHHQSGNRDDDATSALALEFNTCR